jgi:pyruvate dehydrogenase E1 component alpha subunit
MPRTPIALNFNLDYLSILDAQGNLDSALEPRIKPQTLLALHRTMLLARRFDERLLNLQRQGRIGTFPPVKGQEAAHLGAVAQLRETDWMVPSFRELAALLWRGAALEQMIIYNNGFNEGGAVPQGRERCRFPCRWAHKCCMPWGWPGPAATAARTKW